VYVVNDKVWMKVEGKKKDENILNGKQVTHLFLNHIVCNHKGKIGE